MSASDPLAVAAETGEVLAVAAPGTCSCGVTFNYPSRCRWSCCSGESDLYCAACLRSHHASMAPLLLTEEVLGDPAVHVRLAIMAELDKFDATAASLPAGNVAAIGNGIARGLLRALTIFDRHFPDAKLATETPAGAP